MLSPVRHNTFRGNRADTQLPGKGGGLVIFGMNNLIEQNLIISNSAATGGGGLYAYSTGPNTLRNNVVALNISDNQVGTGIYVEDYAIGRIDHTTLVGTGQGSGLYSQQPILVRNMIIGGFATGVQYAGSAPFSIDGVLWYSNTQNTSGPVNVSHADSGAPRFVDEANNDYHVRAGSPAIDAGINAGIANDLDGQTRPFGAGYDLGAYEFAGHTRYVAVTGMDSSNNCLDSFLPCATLQHAVDVAADQDEVRIAAGTYSDLSVRPRADVTTTGVVTQIVYLSKTLALRGGYTTTNWLIADPLSNPTVLDAQAQGRVFYVMGNISPTIDGLQLTNGNPLDMGYDAGCLPGQCLNVGGAVFAITATMTLYGNQIVNNSAGVYKGWCNLSEKCQCSLERTIR